MHEESFSHSSDDTKKDSWKASTSQLFSDFSIHVSESRPTFQLHLISKKESKSKRPLINSTKFERLSFYNIYTTPAWKIDLISSNLWNHKSLIWLHIGNFIFKSLSHTFVHIFLASYAPEEHMFLTKMVPFCVGHKFLIIAASLFTLLVSVNTLYLTFYYFINGLLYKNPWNRCKNSTYYDTIFNITIHCYELEEFSHQFVNMTFHPPKGIYINSNHEYFSLAQYEYLRDIIDPKYGYRNKSLSCYILLWGMAAFLTFYVSKKFFWKVLHYAYWSIILINICTVLYILLKQTGLKEKREFMAPNFSEVNYKYLIYPSSDSTAIVISNATYYMFRIYLSSKMSTYCKNLIGVPLYNFPGMYIFFLVWPIFFSSFYLGDLYSLMFLGLNSVADILSFSVSFRCLIEMVIYEWRKKITIKPWMVIVTVFLSVILVNIFFSEQAVGILSLYAIGFATLFEIIILYIFYPLGRLIDDYTFHYGVSPTKLRKLSLQVVPFYYMFKFFALMYSLYGKRNSIDFEVSQYLWCWSLMVVPLVLGIIFTIYKQHVIRKASIDQLFSPAPDWGPKNFSVRQLRKQYDSRVYIKSEVPRSLTRYLLSQAEHKVYKLNVHYDLHKKHHVPPLEVRFKVEQEKKSK